MASNFPMETNATTNTLAEDSRDRSHEYSFEHLIPHASSTMYELSCSELHTPVALESTSIVASSPSLPPVASPLTHSILSTAMGDLSVQYIGPIDCVNFEEIQKIKMENEFKLKAYRGKIGKFPLPRHKPRFNRMRFAMSCWTTVSKESVLSHLRAYFPKTIRYVCIGSAKDDERLDPHIDVQLLLTSPTNKQSWFLDACSDYHWNYAVTDQMYAWNKYIKAGGDYIEVGSSEEAIPQPKSTARIVKRIPPRNKAEAAARQGKVYANALALGKASIDGALLYVAREEPDMMSQCGAIEQAIIRNNEGSMREQTRKQASANGLYWPNSFPDCTPRLYEQAESWRLLDFHNGNRPRVLIIIGDSGVGKTAFAKCLPGPVNYFKTEWYAADWSAKARYTVIDNVPWDLFEKRGFPDKRDFLTADGSAVVKAKPHKKKLNFTQPCIYLMTPGMEGSLRKRGETIKEQDDYEYWQTRAFIIDIQKGEYFHKVPPGGIKRLGDPNEYIDYHIERLERQQLQRTATDETTDIADPS